MARATASDFHQANADPVPTTTSATSSPATP